MIIYSQRLAGYLMQKGFILQGMNKNEKDISKNIFFFCDSEELKTAMKEFQKIN